jgi:hypothetical protein
MNIHTAPFRIAALALMLGAGLGGLGTAAYAKESVAQVKQRIIRASIAAYPGPCPCPYSVMRNGRSCGGRSAWSRPGGYSPKCYASDVTAEEVAEHRER